MPFHVFLIILNSPFLLVFGDDRVVCHIEAYIISGKADVDA